MKLLLGSNTDEDNDSCFPSLSWSERLWGFIICVAIGTPLTTQAISSNCSPSDPSLASRWAAPPNLQYSSPSET